MCWLFIKERDSTLLTLSLFLLNSFDFDALSVILREYQFDNLSMLNIYVYIELVLACLVFTKFWGMREMRVYLASAIAFRSASSAAHHGAASS